MSRRQGLGLLSLPPWEPAASPMQCRGNAKGLWLQLLSPTEGRPGDRVLIKSGWLMKISSAGLEINESILEHSFFITQISSLLCLKLGKNCKVAKEVKPKLLCSIYLYISRKVQVEKSNFFCLSSSSLRKQKF